VRCGAGWVSHMTKIDNLIEELVGDLSPIGRYRFKRRLGLVIVVGVIGAASGLLVSFGYRSQPHEVTAFAFWIKFVYSAAMMAVTIVALYRVGRPDGTIGGAIFACLTTLSVVSLLAIVQLIMSPASSYEELILGRTAPFCSVVIVAFGLPAFAANMWFLRRAAPINPSLAGFVAGACAGAVGAWVYSWACNEDGIAFIAIWYTVGIAASGALGSLIGARTLRW
jgi:hypothetical protein